MVDGMVNGTVAGAEVYNDQNMPTEEESFWLDVVDHCVRVGRHLSGLVGKGVENRQVEEWALTEVVRTGELQARAVEKLSELKFTTVTA